MRELNEDVCNASHEYQSRCLGHRKLPWLSGKQRFCQRLSDEDEGCMDLCLDGAAQIQTVE